MVVAIVTPIIICSIQYVEGARKLERERTKGEGRGKERAQVKEKEGVRKNNLKKLVKLAKGYSFYYFFFLFKPHLSTIFWSILQLYGTVLS